MTKALAICGGCSQQIPLASVHLGLVAAGQFRLYHRGQRRCGEVIVDRFPRLPPQAPPGYPKLPPTRCSLKLRLLDYERLLIAWALGHTHGNVEQAAALLSVKRMALVRRIAKHGGRRHVEYFPAKAACTG